MDILDLNGAWQVSQAGNHLTLPATVPGCIHADLLAAGKIEDPYYRDNEDAMQWIGPAKWTYGRDIEVPQSLLQREQVLLHCDGLDTFAALYVNGNLIGRADNMFRTWEFDVKAALRPGVNRFEVRFDSVLPYMAQRQRRRPLPAWTGPKEPDGRAWVRKQPCNFGWDWGPCLVTCGIWRGIRLLAFETARLADVHIRQDHRPRAAVDLDISIAAETVARPRLTASVIVLHEGRIVAEQQAVLRAGKGRLQVQISNPRLWWPHGLGEQPLYEVAVELLDADGNLLDSQSRRIGLRTLRLDRRPDKWGESFQFVVNGKPFFAKGANWIPADAVYARLEDADYAYLLESAAEANMNMIRVWGGGYYENDVFYELCDELGLCVWQDFMFGCSTYPTFDDEFMANFAAEAEDNIRRLRHHCCLALWCGNNELEQGLVGDEWSDRQMSWEDYRRLFDKRLPAIVRRLDPERDYWPGSPHSPRGDRRDFNNPRCGDAHLWEVWHGRKPFEWYRTCEHRFNSEFGFQSFPEPRTVWGYTAAEDRNVTSYVMEHHQRSGIGNGAIMSYMTDWFLLPRDFAMTLWLSQVQQGMAIKYAVEHWRRAMPRGMGTLYWQLNDCWPVASWSSIDYHGRWKALHYMAKRFFAPLLISLVEDAGKGQVAIHVTSDQLKSVSGRLAWRLTDAAGKTLAEDSSPVKLTAQRSKRVAVARIKEHLEKHGPRNLMFWAELTVRGAVVSRNFATLCRPKHLLLQDPQLKTTVKQNPAGGFHVTLSAHKPALWTWLELVDEDAQYSDNFVHVAPGVSITIDVLPGGEMTLAAFKKQLRARSLFDTY